jgi:hypothetical protein
MYIALTFTAPLLTLILVARWPLVSKIVGSNTTEVGFFGRKNPQRAFLRRGSKAIGPSPIILPFSGRRLSRHLCASAPGVDKWDPKAEETPRSYRENKVILLTWRIWCAANNAIKWQMGFNWVFKGLKFEVSGNNCSLFWDSYTWELKPMGRI